MFKRNGVYFLLTSGATGWAPNQQKYATATSVDRHVDRADQRRRRHSLRLADRVRAARAGHVGHVLPVPGRPVGRGLGGTVNDSQYVWLPLTFPTATTMTMSWYPQVSIDTATGAVSGVGSG